MTAVVKRIEAGDYIAEVALVVACRLWGMKELLHLGFYGIDYLGDGASHAKFLRQFLQM